MFSPLTTASLSNARSIQRLCEHEIRVQKSSQTLPPKWDAQPMMRIQTKLFFPSTFLHPARMKFSKRLIYDYVGPSCFSPRPCFQSLIVSANKQCSANQNNSYVIVLTRCKTISPRKVAWRWILGLCCKHIVYMAKHAAFTSYRLQIKLEVKLDTKL